MLHGWSCWNGFVEHVQGCLRLDRQPLLLKGTPVFVLLAVIGIIVLTSITTLVIDVRKDGYRRAPERELIPFL